MRIIELFESRSADLYHGTNLLKLNNILQRNVFKASASIRSEVVPREFKGHSRTVSFSRDPNMSVNFARSKAGGEEGINGIPVVIVVDQNKLYQTVGRRMQAYNDLALTHNGTERSNGGSESEEVVFGDINDANAFIKKIIIHMPKNASKDLTTALAKCTNILSDPRTVIVDFINKPLSGKEFINIANNNVSLVSTAA